jgi:hypothetical protein
MKEGYVQMKLAEFSDKCNQIEQMLTMEDAKIRLLQEKVGEYKEFIKKLQDVQTFNTQALAELKKENEALQKAHVERISHRLSEELKELTMNKAETINETIASLQKREKELARHAELLKKHSKDLIFLLEHNDILMMKLVNRKVLNEHDVVEMQRRSSKKAESSE